jgi:hypothetical protein
MLLFGAMNFAHCTEVVRRVRVVPATATIREVRITCWGFCLTVMS